MVIPAIKIWTCGWGNGLVGKNLAAKARDPVKTE